MAGPDARQKMKSLILIVTCGLTACGPWTASQVTGNSGTNEYRIVGGVQWDPAESSPEKQSVENALRRANIDYIYGDHAARLSQLCCKAADVERALSVIRALPPNERTGIMLIDAS